MNRRLLLVSAVLVSSLARVSPGFGRDASVPDASGSTDASKPDGGREAGPRTDASRPRSDASGTTLAVGGACTKSSDCPAGVTCLLPTSTKLGGGGPAKGLCTVDCSVNGQADCDAVDPGSFCFASGEIGYCFERCTGGDPPAGTTKCKDRPDMACTPSSATSAEAYCKPTCRANSDCAPRLCDPVTGLCVDTQSGSKPIGSACDPNAATNDCAGSCIPGGTPPSAENSMCSSACSIGELGACGVDPKATSLPLAACLLSPYPGEGKGDIGGCAQLCSCDRDCLNKSFVCGPVDLATVGRAGMCVPGTDAMGAPVTGISCGAGTGGASGTGGQAGGGQSGSGGGSTDGGTKPVKKSTDSGCGCHVGQGGEGEQNRIGALSLAALGLAMLRRRPVRALRATAKR